MRSLPFIVALLLGMCVKVGHAQDFSKWSEVRILGDTNFRFPTLVLDVCFSDDGRSVATGDAHGNVRVFEIPSGRLLHTVHTGWDDVRQVRFVRGTSRVLVTSMTETGEWELADGLRASLHPVNDEQYTLTLSPDGHRTVSVSKSRLHVLSDGKATLFAEHAAFRNAYPTRFASPSHIHIMSPKPVLVDLETGTVLPVPPKLHSLPVKTVEATGSPAPATISVLLHHFSQDKAISQWTVGASHLNWSRPADALLALSNNGAYALIQSGNDIQVLDTATGVRRATRTVEGRGIRIWAIDNTGQRVVCAQGGALRLWELDGNPAGVTTWGHHERITELALSSDGQRLCSISQDLVGIWDLPSGTATPFAGSGEINGERIRITEDSKHAWLSGTVNGRPVVQYWSLAPHRLLRDATPAIAPEAQYGGAFLLDDLRFCFSAEQSLSCWNLANGRRLWDFPNPSRKWQHAVLSPAGRWLIAAEDVLDGDATVATLLTVVDPADGAQRWRIPMVEVNTTAQVATLTASANRALAAVPELGLFVLEIPEVGNPSIDEALKIARVIANNAPRLSDDSFEVREAAAAAIRSLGGHARLPLQYVAVKDLETRRRFRDLAEEVRPKPVLHRLPLNENGVCTAAAWHPDGQHWAAILEQERSRCLVFGRCDRENRFTILYATPAPRLPQSLVFSQDGRTLYVGNGDTTISVFQGP